MFVCEHVAGDGVRDRGMKRSESVLDAHSSDRTWVVKLGHLSKLLLQSLFVKGMVAFSSNKLQSHIVLLERRLGYLQVRQREVEKSIRIQRGGGSHDEGP